MSRPARYADVRPFVHDYDTPDGFMWDLTIEHNGVPVDLSGSYLAAPVYDDGVHVGDLVIVDDQLEDGVVKLQLEQSLFHRLTEYSTWYLREGTQFNRTLMYGTIVKEMP